MNGRIVLALALAPVVCGAVFAAWLLFGLERPESQIGVTPIILFLPGVMYGAVFEVIALLPLLFLLRRLRWHPTATLILGGAVLWAVAALLSTLATSELALSEFTLRDLAMIHLPIMAAGVALVLVFACVAESGRAA